jgi:hypothetical protein
VELRERHKWWQEEEGLSLDREKKDSRETEKNHEGVERRDRMREWSEGIE